MKLLVWCAFFLIIITNSVQAKWATVENAPIKTSYHQEIKVNKDGTTKEIIETQIEILKEPGRDIVAHYILQYNSDSEKIQILEAKTIYQNKEYKLKKNLIEDKPLASAPHGFDQIRQILLAFPKPEIGAKIYLKYRLVTTKVLLDKFYASMFNFGNKEWVVKKHIELHSQLPLHILVNDPEQALKITKDKEDKFHSLTITLTKPMYKEVTNESPNNVVNNKYLTWVSVSSLNKWEDLATGLGRLYTKVFTQPLPEDFKKIANSAEQKKDEIEQINTVTSLLNDKIQFMGDWRTINGKLVPHDLDKIGTTQLGDCKDFSAATAAILTKLGYKAQIAVVRRGIHNFYPNSLPDLGAFNHAFVKVTNKHGKVYWIDPTNFQSMANGIFPDIATKEALILDPKQPSYEKVSKIDPKHAQLILKRQIEILNDNKIAEHGNITFKNEEAYPITGAALQISEDTIKDFLFHQLSRARLEEKDKKSIKLPDLKSRIVKDISIDYNFEQENKVLKTNLGQALRITYDTLINFFDVSQDYVSDNSVSIAPFMLIRQTTIKNINVQNVESLNKEINTPWLYAARKCSLNNHDLQIDDIIVVYQSLIANENLKAPEFIKLKDDLEKNFKDVAVVFTK